MFTCGDWEKFKDNESQYCYYYNHATKEWQWEKPDGYVEDDNEDVSHRPLSKSEWKIKQTKSQRRFTYGDWDKYEDNESGYFYYYNHATEEWQWEKPDEYFEDDSEVAY